MDIDKSQFTTNLELIGIVVVAKGTMSFLKGLKEWVFRRPKVKAVYNDPNGDASKRLVLLNEKTSAIATEDNLLAGLPQDLEAWVRNQVMIRARIGKDRKSGQGNACPGWGSTT